MAIETIYFNDVTVNQFLGTTTLTGTLTVDYGTLSVSGTLTDGAGTAFSNFGILTSDGGLTYTLQGGGGLLATVSATYAGQAPATVSVTYTSLGLLPGVTPSVAVTSTLVACFTSGTLIRTANGDVRVEDLRIGDLAVTSCGAHRPIRWLGHRTIDCSSHPRPRDALPIRVAAHAFGDSRPARDLLVSPGHAICAVMIDEILMPASSLLNGSTVQQVEVDEITYWHVELDSHDLILAENLLTESYLDMGNRTFFSEGAVVDLDAAPDGDPMRRSHADFCRPFHEVGVVADAVRSQLRARALATGWTLDSSDPYGGLYLRVDGIRIDPVCDDLVVSFAVPAGAKDVWLESTTVRALDVLVGVPDTRELGICLSGLEIEHGSATRRVDLDDPLLCVGFHEIVTDADGSRHRWLAERARLPSQLWTRDGGEKRSFSLRIELAGAALPRWVPPSASSTSTSTADWLGGTRRSNG